MVNTTEFELSQYLNSKEMIAEYLTQVLKMETNLLINRR